MPKIYDNIENHLTKGLSETLLLSQRSDFCVGYFNLRGWGEVADLIDKLPGQKVSEGLDEHHRYCRLLVGMQRLPLEFLKVHYNRDETYMLDNAETVRLKKQLAQEFREQLTIGTPSDSEEKYLRILSRQLKEKKVLVKLHLKHALHAKLYLAFGDDMRIPVVGFLGSSNLTLAGLSRQGELNIDVLEQDAAKKLSKWFDDRWNDRWCIDITEELIQIIDESWAAENLVPPYYIYLKIAYHLSREARAGISEFKLPKVFQNELLDYQQKAVLIAAHHLNRFKDRPNGVLIGDVVGLGKTIVATAIAKVFEEDFFVETLIICPKNLIEMWEGYVHRYRIHAKVISQSMVQTTLPNLRRYRLVIIDESHNLRNADGSRYRAIREYLEENESRVILLSATPYNKSYKDLSNQLRLFIADDADLGISPERYIDSIGGQVQFQAKHTETYIRSIKAFERSMFANDWRELMRLFLVRRTRGFIKNNYAFKDDTNGRKYLTFSDGTKSYFPDRIPKKVEFEFNSADNKDLYARLYSDKVVKILNKLELPRYGLGNYIVDKPVRRLTNDEELVIMNLSRAGKRLMGFCRTNLFKRLESSGHTFLLSISRHILRNYVFIYALENHLDLPIGKNAVEDLDIFLDDSDPDDEQDSDISFLLDENKYLENAKEVYTILVKSYKKRFVWMPNDLVHDDLVKVLIEDSRELIKILALANDWKPEDDRKLNALIDIVIKIHVNDKILIFTQYADTAEYLDKQFEKRNINKYAVVTGDSESPTSFAHRFSPLSNGHPEIAGTENELRILVTTDVLSEGQNLQDGHIVLNYDLPWAIIRLIQRAGRVDRIGQRSDKIICYSFLPEAGIENIIRLRGRLAARIKENSEVVGSDETFFDGDPVNIHDLYSEKSGVFEENDDDSEVDLASYAYQIWKNAVDKNSNLAKTIPDIPNVVYGTKKNPGPDSDEGVIVYTRTSEDNDVLAWLDSKGRLITQSQLTILKAAECKPDTPALMRLSKHHDLVRKAVDIIKTDDSGTGGALGKKTGVKFRVYMRLDRYCKENEGTFWITEELKKAIDDIYKYPLKEYGRDTINRQLKTGISDQQLAELVVSLRDDDKLCIHENDGPVNRLPQIICSMGLRNGEK